MTECSVYLFITPFIPLSLSFLSLSLLPLPPSLLQAVHISRETFKEFNSYLMTMADTLWTGKMFLPGTAMEVRQELLADSGVPEYWKSFDLIHHPAFLSYAFHFHCKVGLGGSVAFT